MPFAVYMVGYLVVMAALVFAAVVAGIPQQYVAIGLVLLLALGITLLLSRLRAAPPWRRGR